MTYVHDICHTLLEGYCLTTWILCMCPYDYMHVCLYFIVYVLMPLCECPYPIMCVSSYTGKSYYILVRWFEAHPARHLGA